MQNSSLKSNYHSIFHFGGQVLSSVAIAVAIAATSFLSPAMAANTQGPAVIPAPRKCDLREGALALSPQSRIVAADAKLAPLAKLLADEIELLTSSRLTTADGAPRPGDIVLAVSPTLKGEEYSIDVGNKAAVKGGNADAVALGTTTLLQAMTKGSAGIEIPRMSVRDKPAVEYRGLLIDCARQWHSVKTLKQMVVLCRWYKIRYLQLHLTDSQSFTFPSTAFPKLATPGRHYSMAELRDLEAFARVRGVTIVPELETPGHAAAMVAAMPELFMPGSKNPNAICAGREKVYEALDTLVGEIGDVFPSTPYFHIGGDEVDYNAWKDCADTKAYMAARKIETPVELYRHFLVRMNEIVKRHGKKTIVWEGFARAGKPEIPRDIIVMAYESKFNVPPDLIADGYQVINAAWQPLYVANGRNWSPEYIYRWNLYRWENWWDQSKAFPKGIDVKPTPQVIGAQMCAWEQPESLELPSLRERVAAMSERIWNPAAGRTFADFAERIRKTDAQLSKLLK